MNDRNLIANEMEESIYVVDINTYEILYVNDAIKKVLGKNPIGQKCYEALQGKKDVCEFCTNKFLAKNNFYKWEYYNPILKKTFILKDKKILWENNREARLEIGIDISSILEEKNNIERNLEFQKNIYTIIKDFYKNSDLNLSIKNGIENIGKYIGPDRVYVFEFNFKNETMNNTYEWCNKGVEPQINKLQNLSFEEYSWWIKQLEINKNIILEDINILKKEANNEYNILNMQGIKSIIVVPIVLNGKISGFIGIDNPKKYDFNKELILTVSNFISVAMERNEVNKHLEKLSYYDNLTNIYNRNMFNNYVKDLKKRGVKSLGVIYMDINGLKRANDVYGHSFGDKVIMQTAQLIKSSANKFPVFRVGGDEFVIIIENMRRYILEDIVTSIKENFNQNRDIDIAIGYYWKENVVKIDDIINKADKNMYKIKKTYYKKFKKLMMR